MIKKKSKKRKEVAKANKGNNNQEAVKDHRARKGDRGRKPQGLECN